MCYIGRIWENTREYFSLCELKTSIAKNKSRFLSLREVKANHKTKIQNVLPTVVRLKRIRP